MTTIIHSSPKEGSKPEFLQIQDILYDSVMSPSISEIEEPVIDKFKEMKTHQRMVSIDQVIEDTSQLRQKHDLELANV